jgi:hypothetical protein
LAGIQKVICVICLGVPYEVRGWKHKTGQSYVYKLYVYIYMDAVHIDKEDI